MSDAKLTTIAMRYLTKEKYEEFKVKHISEIRKYCGKQNFQHIASADVLQYLFEYVIPDWEVLKFFQTQKEEMQEEQKKTNNEEETQILSQDTSIELQQQQKDNDNVEYSDYIKD